MTYNYPEQICKIMAHTWGKPEQVRNELSKILLPRANDPSDPHDAEYYEDLIEVIVDRARDDGDPAYFKVGIEDNVYECETAQELGFLDWIRQYMRRGLDFKSALDRAKQRIILVDANVNPLVYDLDKDDKWRINHWIGILTDQGIAESQAQGMAEEVVRLLRQQYLVTAVELFPEDDQEKGRLIRDKLKAARAAETAIY